MLGHKRGASKLNHLIPLWGAITNVEYLGEISYPFPMSRGGIYTPVVPIEGMWEGCVRA